MTVAQCKTFSPTHRFTVQKPDRTATAGDDGAVDLSTSANWETHVICMGRLRSVSGRELFTEQQTQATRSHVVEMWSSSDTRAIKPDYRLTYRDRDNVQHVLGVVAVIESSDGKFVELSCLELVL